MPLQAVELCVLFTCLRGFYPSSAFRWLTYTGPSQYIRILNGRHCLLWSFISVWWCWDGSFYVAPSLTIIEDIITMFRISFSIVLSLQSILFACSLLIQRFRKSQNLAFLISRIFTSIFLFVFVYYCLNLVIKLISLV